MKPLFTDTYDSEEIGFFRVGEIDLHHPVVCEAGDVHSKCGLVSLTVKIGTEACPAGGECLDPLPESVREVANSPSSTPRKLAIAYKRAFKKYPYPTWFCFSLLLPGRDT